MPRGQLHAQVFVTHLSQAEGKEGGSADTWLPYGCPATCCSSLRHAHHTSLGGNGPDWAWTHFLVWGTSILSLQSWPGHKEPAQGREREPGFLSVPQLCDLKQSPILLSGPQ